MTGAKPKPSGKRAEPLTPAEQLERFHDAVGSKAYSEPPMAKPAKLDVEKLTPGEQRYRFFDAAREAGASEGEATFDAAIKRIAWKMLQSKG